MDNQRSVVFNRAIPVKYDTDVFIAGGGPAGVAAALAAANTGAATFLAEGQACLGGLGTSGLIPAFMQFTDGINFLAGGMGEKILNKLKEEGGHESARHISLKVEVLKRIYDEFLQEAKVDFSFQTQLIGLEIDGKKVSHVILSSKSGIFAVRSKIYIDCTGDGDLSAWAGAPFEKGDIEGNMMAGTLCSLWAGIEWDNVVKPDGRKLEEAFGDSVFTTQDRHLPGMWRVGNHTGGGNIGHTFGVDGTDEKSLTEALIKGRKLILEYEKYYKKYLTGFENMELISTAALLGIRETRRILGDYVLTLDDFKNRAVFEDEIGRYSYPVDIHAGKSDNTSYREYEENFRSLRYGKGESYGIPYRALIPRGLSNVLVAGRCISTDRYMQSSVRVMPGCYITGQAAGTAAAIAVKNDTDTRGINIRELQKRIVSMGGYLPNFK